MIRLIVSIDEELCNGCELCVDACHEGAIQMINGKARLVHDRYCDGLGDCLPACPTGAIRIIEREAEAFDEAAVEQRLAELARQDRHRHEQGHGGCPGSMNMRIERKSEPESAVESNKPDFAATQRSELTSWPIQLALVNPAASFLEDADLLIAADCTAFAYGEFHRELLRNRIALIGCPKLDNNGYYIEKMTEILKRNRIRSITAVRMSVPCCAGIVNTVKQAMLLSQTIVPYSEVTIGIDGSEQVT